MKILFSIFIISFALLYSKGQEGNSQLKSQIEILFKNNEIDSINSILNKENSLEPEYVLETLIRNIEFSQNTKDYENLARSYLILGNFWHKQANKIKAHESYLEGELAANKIKDKTVLATILMNKSTLLEDKKERIKALSEAAQIFEETKDTMNVLKSFINIGVAYSQLYEEANDSVYSKSEIEEFKKSGFVYYSKAENLNKKLKNKEFEGMLNIYYGEWYKHEKQYEKAIESFKKAQKVLVQTQNKKAETYCIYYLARIATEQQKYTEALELLGQAEKISEKHKFHDFLSRIYQEYVTVYSEKGDYKKALEYNQLYTKKIVELTEQSNNDKMQIISLEKNLAENKFQISEYESKSKINRILIISSFLIVLAVAGISYLIIKNNKRKIDNIEKNNIITEIKLKNQLLEDELLKEKVKFSQEHLMSFANQVTKIENFLDNMKTKLKKVPGTREEINDLKISFSELLNGQSQLKKINSLSSELNQDFFFHIKQNYPGISKGDEQLLAYIILDISSKEISRILNISDKSIYIKRYRLRKKLNLENEETFQDFYQKIISELN